MSVTTRSSTRKAATHFLERASFKRYGVSANVAADVVDQLGATASVNWFSSNLRVCDDILATWGPLRTHYLIVAISATNGCSYSAYSHGYAFVLHYFNQTGELFPLSEHDLQALASREDHEVASVLEQALEQAGMATEVPWLQRMLTLHQALRHGRVNPSTQDQKWLYHLIRMFRFLNDCCMRAGTEPDEAHDAINKDFELRRRYERALTHTSEPPIDLTQPDESRTGIPD